ncbi:hypothetical protein HEK616_20990 [Streptomyces nigrescens]|uniref:Uncharacterized protein n=2 Tax=Streptomyces TaxID=1883 RepID=A0ABN6QR08_STRNI|nr:hypothetical protein [Streptomyces nigrescens]MEE4419954.1 hypothetical protein [Streptomyces sp. DSM 41528]BDM68612.1 hypothetical protein HEK616_20990 [Streptomyces nigrescens]
MFVSAGHTDSTLVRTADGWRIAASAQRIVRTRGTPPRVPADPGAAVREGQGRPDPDPSDRR